MRAFFTGLRSGWWSAPVWTLTTVVLLVHDVAARSYLDLVSSQTDNVDMRRNEDHWTPPSPDGRMRKDANDLTLNGQQEHEKKMFAHDTADLWNVVLKHAGLQTSLVADAVEARAHQRRTILGVHEHFAAQVLASVERHAYRLFSIDADSHWHELSQNLQRLAEVLRPSGDRETPSVGLKLRPGYNPENAQALAYTYTYTMRPQFAWHKGPFSVWVMKNMAEMPVSGVVYDPDVWNLAKQPQTLILIHEGTHAVLGTDDIEYADGLMNQRPIETLTRREQFANADNYAYFVTMVIWDLVKAGSEAPEHLAKAFADTDDLLAVFTVQETGKFMLDMPHQGWSNQEDKQRYERAIVELVRTHLRPDTCTRRCAKDIGDMNFPPVPYALRHKRMRQNSEPGPFDVIEHVTDAIKMMRLLCMNFESTADPSCA
ncbi:unnamed protein product [Amoebophrya sp. A120]|nr:unnamed protein product [Amoebophrya sp. A120]|eukprot:GSA120T00003492001.1